MNYSILILPFARYIAFACECLALVLDQSNTGCWAVLKSHSLHRSGTSCSKAGQHYPPDRPLSRGCMLKKEPHYPLESDLSGGYHYPPFEKPRPVLCKIKWAIFVQFWT